MLRTLACTFLIICSAITIVACGTIQATRTSIAPSNDSSQKAFPTVSMKDVLESAVTDASLYEKPHAHKAIARMVHGSYVEDRPTSVLLTGLSPLFITKTQQIIQHSYSLIGSISLASDQTNAVLAIERISLADDNGQIWQIARRDGKPLGFASSTVAPSGQLVATNQVQPGLHMVEQSHDIIVTLDYENSDVQPMKTIALK